jgi:2,3-bisphosphoglycerate-independent phosphoglycerate mutase
MVGHTGNMHAVTTSLAALDICVERVLEAIKKANGVLIITADHGNADDMYEHDKKSGSVKCDENGEPSRKTSHSLNPVPAIVVDMAENKEYKSELKDGLGISSIPATVMNFLGFDAPEEYDQSILVTK